MTMHNITMMNNENQMYFVIFTSKIYKHLNSDKRNDDIHF